MPRPSITISPYPRTICETFDRETGDRLGEAADIVRGSDEPMLDRLFEDALSDAAVVAIISGSPPTRMQYANPELIQTLRTSP
jgi:hypothetical protein